MMIHPRYIFLLGVLVLTVVSIAAPFISLINTDVIILWIATVIVWAMYIFPRRKK